MISVHGRAYVERAPEQGPVPFIAANEGLMADGIDLKMDTLDLARFELNPIIGYGHDYWGRDALPIGRSVETAVDGPRLRMLVEFDPDDDFARKVDRKVRKGYLNTMSVGFSVSNIDDAGVPESWELFESSVVPLPMDPNATAERLARSLSALHEGQAVTAEDATELLRAAGLEPPRLDVRLNSSASADDALVNAVRAALQRGGGHAQVIVDDAGRDARERRLRLARSRQA